MPTILVSASTLENLEKLAVLPMRRDARPGPKGLFVMWVDDEVLARLLEIALPGESEEDTIQRLLCEKGYIRRN